MNSRAWSASSSASSRRKSHRKKKRKRSNVSCNNECNFEREKGKLEPVWFWTNYYKALAWQKKHETAIWKSYALGLEYERMCLLEQLGRLGSGCNEWDASVNREAYSDSSSGCASKDEGLEFEMSDEMMKFFEQSFKHKLEMKKQKAKDVDQIEVEVKELKEAHEQREKEMKLLYGEGSCMIIGMETAVQLSFDKYCDMKSPKYWPNIPLNL